MLMARFLGASFATDAFLIALRLPNMFRALFAEGAFASAFVPLFNEKMSEEAGSLEKALRFADQALAVLLPFLLLFTGLMMLFAGPAVLLLSGGFNDPTPGQFAFAVELARTTFPYLLFISVVSLLGGILNSLHKFWVNAAAPILLNLCLIGAMLFFNGPTDEDTARAMAWGVTASACCSCSGCSSPAPARARCRASCRPRLDEDVKRLLKLIWPAAAGAGAMQINLLISTMLAASLLPVGSVTYIDNADRLNQLPLGLVGIGLGTVLLPTHRPNDLERRRGRRARLPEEGAAARALPQPARRRRPDRRRRADHPRAAPIWRVRRRGHHRHRRRARRFLDRPARLHPDQGADPGLPRPPGHEDAAALRSGRDRGEPRRSIWS